MLESCFFSLVAQVAPQVWQRLFQGVIFVDVLILLVLSGASALVSRMPKNDQNGHFRMF